MKEGDRLIAQLAEEQFKRVAERRDKAERYFLYLIFGGSIEKLVKEANDGR